MAQRLTTFAALLALTGVALIGITARAAPADAYPTAPDASCPPSLDRGSNPTSSEGGPIDAGLYMRSTGELTVTVFFVDFSDAPGTESLQGLWELVGPGFANWYAEASYGRVLMRMAPVFKWFRMPRRAVDYGFADGTTFAEHRAFLVDAIAVADPEIDFSRTDLVITVSALTPAIPGSPAFHARAGGGTTADGRDIRWWSNMGRDIRNPNWGYHVPVHEVGHIMGLPDLYAYTPPPGGHYWMHVGAWDVMSSTENSGHFLAWHKQRLGWLDASQFRCLDGGGSVEETLTPLETSGGLKAVALQTGPSTAYVIEARRRIGQDAGLCDEGVLVYTVDATVPSGQGPIQIKTAHPGEGFPFPCGPLWAAGIDSGEAFEDAVVRVQVLSSNTDGSYRVRVTRKLAGTFALTVSRVERGGTGTIEATPAGLTCENGTCIGDFAEGTDVTLRAKPGPQARFVGWGGACSGTATTCTLTLDAPKSVEAVFATAPRLLVKVVVRGRGKVTGEGISCPPKCSRLLATGSRLILRAKPAKGWRLARWSGPCSRTSRCSIAVRRPQTVRATFVRR